MRQKTRLRAREKMAYEAQYDAKVLPELKKWLNGLPLKERIYAAWLLIWGVF